MTTVVNSSRVKLKEKIKLTAGQRILNLLPEWKQRNLIARGVELNDKALLVGNAGLTTQEVAEKDYIKAQWAKVVAIRSHSDQLELDVDAGLSVDLENDWPF